MAVLSQFFHCHATWLCANCHAYLGNIGGGCKHKCKHKCCAGARKYCLQGVTIFTEPGIPSKLTEGSGRGATFSMTAAKLNNVSVQLNV